MRILAAARHPGPAESVGPTVQVLRNQGHDVLLIGVDGMSPEAKSLGGSVDTFHRAGISCKDISYTGYTGSIVDIPLSFANKLIEEYRPDRILVGCSSDESGLEIDIEAILVEAGQSRSIHTVQIVEAWGCWRPKYNPHFASIYANLDRLTADINISRGAPRESIRITGHPGLDKFYDFPVDINRSLIRKQLGISKERIIVYFGQAEARPGSPRIPMTLRWVIDSLGHNDRLIFSSHPRDTRDYNRILAIAGNSLLQTGLDSHQLVSLADIVITHFSSMGLKSVISGVPTINILLKDDEQETRISCGGFPISLLGGNYEANNQDDVRKLLGETLIGKNRDEIRSALMVDGKAANRVAHLLTNL